MITRHAVSQKLQAYLNEEITLPQIVDWAESAMVDGDFEDESVELLADIVGRIGLADVENFRLYWEDIADMLEKLGYHATVLLEPA